MKRATFHRSMLSLVSALAFRRTCSFAPCTTITSSRMTRKGATIKCFSALKASACSTVPTHIKGVFCGSGSDAMNDPRIVQAILDLLPNKDPCDIKVLYLGTATYDIQGFFIRQTERFVQAGCQVQALKVAGVDVDDDGNNDDDEDLAPQERLEHYNNLIHNADVLVVGGGNTLFALDRWRKLGLIPALRQAADRGAVLTGGSAGAICWFDGGHSNAADPATFKNIRIRRFKNRSAKEIVDEIYSYKPMDTDESDTEMSDSEDDQDDNDDSNNNNSNNNNSSSSWEYFRVSALGFLPGLVSPHLDRVQSNGVLRAYDFDKCLLKHAGENGIGIDHFAALIVDGPKYRVLSLPDREGTNRNGQFVPDGSGKPAVWIKQVMNGRVRSTLCPEQGLIHEILKVATCIVEDDEATNKCRRANPDDGWVPPATFAVTTRQ